MTNTIVLEAAVATDAAALAQLHADAFATERVTLLKSLDTSYVHADQMLPPISHWIAAAPGVQLIKAVDASSRALLGWACWRMEADALAASTEPEPSPTEFDATPTGLGKFTGAHMGYWQRSLVPKLLAATPRHRILISITVAPEHQRRGVGAALLEWGLGDAPCWVHASEVGHKLFEAHGFQVEASLVLQLDDWAQGAPPPSGHNTWGTTTFRYMIRPPKA
ncbi:Aste57867_11579 [Aphanomyces stellatus]|uniref:Aste57867_11579 protein n=1 Tax=Aphanomyces stellatus TaxID=120398 RepID=A0A485KTR1_9STRA|nr:hypothetical protein As57867_011536 [Aphanomyces stellatus]VFT88438.1 Aste57867_11579 [Aphanomyces stellatus]